MKKPTPKKQQSNAQSKRRYKIFQNNTRKRLAGAAKLTACPNCKEPRLAHTICPHCGVYKGRKAVSMEKKIDKIVKVKA